MSPKECCAVEQSCPHIAIPHDNTRGEIEVCVLPTQRRIRAKNEFIVQMGHSEMDAIGVQCCSYVTVETGPDVAGRKLRVLAGVRCLPKPICGNPCKLGVSHVRMDLALRQAVGVSQCNTWSSPSTVVLRRARRPPVHFLSKCLGYQYVVCRVQRAHSGDAETPLCRAPEWVMQTLGLNDGGGLIVAVSTRHSVKIRMLPLTPSNRA